MSFTRWYPQTSHLYDPALQPTKPIANLQAKDDAQNRKVPQGRYDTTYRREYLNVEKNKLNQQQQQQQRQQQQGHNQSNNLLNPYNTLPPINNNISQQQGQNAQYGNSSIHQQQQPHQPITVDHLIPVPSNQSPPVQFNQHQLQQPQNQQQQQNAGLQHQQNTESSSGNDDFLPVQPVLLNQNQEQNLSNDVVRELGQMPLGNLKAFYTDMTQYDPQLIGFAHYQYVQLAALKNNLPLSEQLMRFLMSRHVSPSQERGMVNYEEMVKFLARCLGEPMAPNPMMQQSAVSNAPNSQAQGGNITNRSEEQVDKYDPDEQAILRLMHENMRDWDQINLINTDNLRKRFYEVDPYNRYILTQPEIADVLYKNRVPIQRSLTYQILEKYCKAATGQYKWPAFVDFLEKTMSMRLPNKKKNDFVYRDDEKSRTSYDAQFTYRTQQLENVKSKVNEEDRLEEINKQIYNLQQKKDETSQRIQSRLSQANQNETWFIRFLKLASTMYNHRVNNGTTFSLPKDEAKRLLNAYNTVFELEISEQAINEAVDKCSLKGNVVIDNLLKMLSHVNN